MNQTVDDEIDNGPDSPTNAPGDRKSSRRKPMFIALAVIGLVVLGAILIWIFRGGESGRAVPAPRTVSFGTGEGPPTGASPQEQTIRLEPGQAERLGLKIETVGETLSSEATAMAATGVVQPNAYAETPVISLVGGVIRRVNVVLGQYVGKGQPVAVVFSDELATAQSRYLALQTEVRTARQNYERAAKLVRINPVSRAELDAAQAKLKSNEASLDEMRRRYDRTVKLVEIGGASREELEQDRTRLRSAEAELQQARSQFQRASQVARINPVSNAEFEQAAVKLRTAESDLEAARQRLIVLGLPAGRVNSLRSPSQITSELAITAPVSGTVTARSINQGEVVEANKELARVTNLSTVWVIAQVFETDLGRLRVGSGASVTTNSYPGRLFRGRVTYIDPNINQQTRTAQVRVELENPGQMFKIGMYVNVAFGSMGAAEKTMPVVASAAVQNVNNQQVVFLATADAGKFVARPVRAGPENDGRYIVLEGLNVGDRVVTDGSFLLRAELLKQNPTGQ